MCCSRSGASARPMRLMPVAAWLVLGLLPLHAHAEQCEPAEAAIEVLASVVGSDTLTVSYTVVNKTGSGLIWISVGTAGPERTRVVPQQAPVVKSTPPQWAGAVVYIEETPYMHLWWEAKEAGAALPPGTTASGFVVQVAGPASVTPGLRGMDGREVRPIDFGALPFTVGGTGARCWWGRVRSAAADPAR